jgi:hypothetical protein
MIEQRNDPIRLTDPRPIPVYDDNVHTGDTGKDGYTLLSRADPNRQGSPPAVEGTEGYVYRGPDQSFEQ